MKLLLRQRRFAILATLFLAGLALFTLPMSYALWREVLGAGAHLDMADPSTPTPLIVTATPTSTVIATPTAVPSLPALGMTLVPNTVVPSPEVNYPAITPEIPTNLPATDLFPTISPPTDPPPTEPPPTEESSESPTELPTDAPTESSPP